MTQPRTLVTCLFCCLVIAAPVASQQRPAAPLPACAQEQRLQPGERTPRMPDRTGETLTDKLARSDGVLCPPEVDPAIKAPTPEAGRTPVLPPPGSPGSDQGVHPK